MRYLLLLGTALQFSLFEVPGIARSPMSDVAEVAVAPFAVERDSGGVLRAVADTCLERLVRELTVQGVAVARYPELSQKNLQVARPVPLAVLGRVGPAHGLIQGELHLLEVESGEELRSYFNADKDPDAVGNLGAAAGKRIAQLIRDRKSAQ